MKALKRLFGRKRLWACASIFKEGSTFKARVIGHDGKTETGCFDSNRVALAWAAAAIGKYGR
jgi:hypothetical protein